MRLYLSGPMSVSPDNNFPAFDLLRDALRARGHEVVSPADLSRAKGWSQDGRIAPPGAGYADVLPDDMDAIERVDAIYMMRGWERSNGCKLEHAYAVLLDKKIVYEADASEL